jgi:hypothetical protein
MATMTVSQRVLKAIQTSPRLCDDCRAKAIGVNRHQVANEVRPLESAKAIQRGTRPCAACGRSKLVTW